MLSHVPQACPDPGDAYAGRIRSQVDTWPPFSPAQRALVAALLAPAVEDSPPAAGVKNAA